MSQSVVLTDQVSDTTIAICCRSHQKREGPVKVRTGTIILDTQNGHSWCRRRERKKSFALQICQGDLVSLPDGTNLTIRILKKSS